MVCVPCPRGVYSWSGWSPALLIDDPDSRPRSLNLDLHHQKTHNFTTEVKACSFVQSSPQIALSLSISSSSSNHRGFDISMNAATNRATHCCDQSDFQPVDVHIIIQIEMTMMPSVKIRTIKNNNYFNHKLLKPHGKIYFGFHIFLNKLHNDFN